MPQSQPTKTSLHWRFYASVVARHRSPLSFSPVLTSFVLATAGKTRPGIFDPVNRMDKKNRGRLARDESGVGERAEKEKGKGMARLFANKNLSLFIAHHMGRTE